MLTLNIEDNSVKIALIKGKRVVAAIETPLEPGAVQNGVIVNKQAVSQLIVKILAEKTIKEKEVLACVSAVHSIYRVVSVPRLDRKLLTEVARKEMERVSPIPLDTLYITWHEVRMSGTESSLCLMGLPHDNVDSVVETVKLSGLKIKALELRPLVVARVIDEKTAAMVNIKTGSFDIIIVDNTIPELIRSLSFPGETMTENEKMGVIKEELARTINFYNSSHADRQLKDNTSCFLSGIVSSDLVPELGYRVKPLPNPVIYPADIDAIRFAANTGLALGESGDSNRWMQVKINILQRLKKTGQAPRANAWPLIVLAVGACLIAAMFVLTNIEAKNTAGLQTLVDEKTMQVAEQQKLLLEDRDKIVKQRDELKATLNILKTPLDKITANRSNINRDIGQVIALLPGVVYLTSIGDTGEVITLSGLAPDADTVFTYALSLRQSGLFKRVTITSLNNKSYNDMKFSMILETSE